jgi:hypothetical protein
MRGLTATLAILVLLVILVEGNPDKQVLQESCTSVFKEIYCIEGNAKLIPQKGKGCPKVGEEDKPPRVCPPRPGGNPFCDSGVGPCNFDNDGKVSLAKVTVY